MIKRLTAWLSDVRLAVWLFWYGPPPPQEDGLGLGRYLSTARLGKTETDPVVSAAAHCCNCGHRGTVLVPDGQTAADLENEILDMLQCPVCGLYTMCSD